MQCSHSWQWQKYDRVWRCAYCHVRAVGLGWSRPLASGRKSGPRRRSE